MTDIKRHLPAVFKLIRRALAGLDGERGGPLPAAALARLRADLGAELPASYLVGDGPVRLPSGGWSLPLDLVIYDRTLLRATGAGEPGAEHALAAFRLSLWPGAAELAADLAAIASLKA
ncbi:MAG TPA: hypothetical protein VGE07_16960, partial [Herpetosiphonaceae bacterium]